MVAIATLPIVLADGGCWRRRVSIALRGIQFIIQDEVRAIIPRRKDCTEERSRRRWSS